MHSPPVGPPMWLLSASLTNFLCFTPHSGFSSHKLGKGSSGSSRSALILQVKEVKHPRMIDLSKRCFRLVHGAGVRSFVRMRSPLLSKKICSGKMPEILMGEAVVGRQQSPDCCTARTPELQRRRHRHLKHSLSITWTPGNITTASHQSCLRSKRKTGPHDVCSFLQVFGSKIKIRTKGVNSFDVEETSAQFQFLFNFRRFEGEEQPEQPRSSRRSLKVLRLGP